MDELQELPEDLIARLHVEKDTCTFYIESWQAIYGGWNQKLENDKVMVNAGNTKIS